MDEEPNNDTPETGESESTETEVEESATETKTSTSADDTPEKAKSESNENGVEASPTENKKSTTTDDTPDLKPKIENRNAARVNLNRPVLIRLSSGETVKAHLVNLSCQGLAFEYPASAETGAAFEILFQLAGKKGVLNIQAEGVTMHIHVKSESFVIGIEFTKIAEEHVDIIEAFVESRLTSAAQLTGFAVSNLN